MSLRSHYVPRYYLRGFSEDGQTLVVYHKEKLKYFVASIGDVAVRKGFYSEEIEEYLANKIEAPANKTLAKVRRKTPLSEEDKIALSRYIVVMWKRVPRAKQRFKARAPKVAEQEREKVHTILREIAAGDPSKAELVDQRRREADSVLDRMASNPPDDIFFQILPPEATPLMVVAVATMSWTFLTAGGQWSYISCDNPVFHFESLGIGRPNSELSLPLCSDVALFGSYSLELGTQYVEARPKLVKEVNRRTASIAEEYVYHSRNEQWVLPFLKKGNWKLHKLV